MYLVADSTCFFLAGGEKVHFRNSSTLHSNVAVEEFGNIASEPQHLYDNINELNAHRKPTTVGTRSTNPTPPSTICVQPCPAYAEFPQIPRSLTTRPAVQTNQDTFYWCVKEQLQTSCFFKHTFSLKYGLLLLFSKHFYIMFMKCTTPMHIRNYQ